MRLLICGGRHFDDSMAVEDALTRFHEHAPVSVLIHGGLAGLGTPAEAWARRNAVHLIRYPANFSLGKQGDFVRDGFMLEDSRAEAVLAFPGGRRTAELCADARARGIPILEVRPEASLPNLIAA